MPVGPDFALLELVPELAALGLESCFALRLGLVVDCFDSGVDLLGLRLAGPGQPAFWVDRRHSAQLHAVAESETSPKLHPVPSSR